MARAKVQSIHDVPTKTALPPATPVPSTVKQKTHLSRSERHKQLADELLGAAEVGAASLLTLVREGAIKGRDLAVVVGILIDKVAMLEQRQEPPSASVADLIRHGRELAALTEELERREHKEREAAAQQPETTSAPRREHGGRNAPPTTRPGGGGP